MKGKLLLLLALCSVTMLQAQNVDSLKQLLSSAEGKQKLSLILELQEVFTCGDSIQFGAYSQLAHQEFQQQSDDSLKVNYLNNLAYDNYCQGNMEKTLSWFDSASVIALKAGNLQKSGRMKNNVANLYQMMGSYQESITSFKKAISLGQQVEDIELVGSATMGIGITYQQQGLLDSALTYYLQAEKLVEPLGNTRVLLRAKHNIATLYYEFRPERLKKEDFEEVLAVAKAINDTKGEMDALEFLGYYSLMKKTPDAALSYFQQGLAINKTVQNPASNILLLKGISTANFDKGSFQESITYGDRALQASDIAGIKAYKPELYHLVAKSCVKLKNYKKAIAYNQKAIELGDEIDKKEFAFDAYKGLAEANFAMGKYKEAYQAHVKYSDLRKAVLNEETSKQLTELQTKYDTEKKENEIAQLSKANKIAELESQRNQYFFIGASIIALLILGLSVIFYSQLKAKRRADLMQAELESSRMQIGLEKQFRKAELKALKSQMNPHFIFNALNSIQEYIILNEKEHAANYLGKFADLIRSYLYYSNQSAISLADDVQALQLYLELEKVRFEEDFEFDIQKNLKSSSEEIEIPTMLIQPYVENAIKHGLLHKQGNKRLKIMFSELNGALQCEVIDNGVGRKRSAEINAKKYHNHKSFASEATKNRLELLNHNSSQKIGVDYQDLEEAGQAAGTKVTLTIPINHK